MATISELDGTLRVFKFQSTGLLALVLETADWYRQQTRLGNRWSLVGYQENDREGTISFVFTPVEKGTTWISQS